MPRRENYLSSRWVTDASSAALSHAGIFGPRFSGRGAVGEVRARIATGHAPEMPGTVHRVKSGELPTGRRSVADHRDCPFKTTGRRGRTMVPGLFSLLTHLLMKDILKFLTFSLLFAGLCGDSLLAALVVSNVTFSQRADASKLVDITYDLASTGGAVGPYLVALAVSGNGGATYAVPVKSVTGDVGDGVLVGTGKRIVWDAGTDWPGRNSTRLKVEVRAGQSGSYTFVSIPAGSYMIGNLIWDTDFAVLKHSPVTNVTLSGFQMSVNDMVTINKEK